MSDLEDFRSVPLLRHVFTSVVLDIAEVPHKERGAVLEFFAINRKFTAIRMLVMGGVAMTMPLQVSAVAQHLPSGSDFPGLNDIGRAMLLVGGWLGFAVGCVGLFLALRAWESHRAATWLLDLHNASASASR